MDEVLAMSRREADRLHVIRNALEGRLTRRQAASMLGLSVRQVKRLCKRVKEEGARGAVHRLRGRPSNHQVAPGILEQALGALHNPLWEGFGPVFARDKLRELCRINLGRETVRQLMTAVGLWEPWGRRVKHRGWRERRPMLGMLVQLDGSTHAWFEGRGPVCVLLLYIDDATSRILHAEFVPVEATLILMRATRDYLRRWGRPLAFYVDRDAIYKTTKHATVEEQFREEQPMTQFTRAMSELGIEVIAANSPQAKGRVERSFQTHQDRLVKELRLRSISAVEEANRFLRAAYIPEHNSRYAVRPASPADAHRPLLQDQDLREILSVRIPRVVQSDYTVRYQGRFFQLSAHQPVRLRPKDEIVVQRRLDGSLRLLAKGGRLEFVELPGRPQRRAQGQPERRHKKRTGRPRRRFRPRGTFMVTHSMRPLNPPASAHLQ